MKDLELIVPEKLDVEAVFVGGETDTILNKIRSSVNSIVRDVDSEDGRKSIASIAYKVSQTKVLLDNLGKKYVSDIKAKVKIVDNNRKKIRDTLDSLRNEYREPLTKYEEAEKRREEEEARKEQERVQSVAAELFKYGVQKSFPEIAAMTLEECQAAVDDARILFEAEIARKAEEDRIAAEKKAAEEQQMAEERAALEKKRKEQEEADALIKAEREKLAAERHAIEIEKAKVEAAAAAKLKAEQDEARRAQEAVAKAERDRIENEERIAREKAETIRQEALKPDKEKLLAFAQFLEEGINYPEVASKDAEAILGRIEIELINIASRLIKDAERM